ncbi:hypothetical protein [Microbacterium sp. C7(2022)]|uniref:hypothetical protein n=1 Tax=Microbacterium sp. C7(2022) TaxID=2992759 RepID=UPI00237BB47A|nr:hypothetical protein [Microbacterium sp. C7(2022)]MDE0547481.1 hypothetical protein [Microbacterium sp. C7(2022)]
MTQITLQFDQNTTIMIPGGPLRGESAASWAASAASHFIERSHAGQVDAVALAGVLEHVRGATTNDPDTNTIIFEPQTHSFAHLRISVLDASFSDEAKRGFLSPPSVVRPQIRRAESPGLGAGCSSTVMDDDRQGVVRWLFAPGGMTVCAVLGPLPPTSVMLTAATAEALLGTVRIHGITEADLRAFDVDAFLATRSEEGSGWAV